MSAATFLCPDTAARGRLVDMAARLRPIEWSAIGLLLAATAVGVPTFGWAPLATLGAAAAAFWRLHARVGRFRRPEYAMATVWLFAELMCFAAIAGASGPRVYLLPLFIFPTMLASVIFPTRNVLAGVALSVALMTAAALLFDLGAVAATPPLLFYPVAALVALSILSSAARAVDIRSRSTAVVDQLTGTLNRAALMPRVAELAHQAETTGEHVGVIVADVDHFKSVNDRRGHAVGDAALREIAYRLRKQLGPFESLYRFGGEEFVVLLAGADLAAAAAAADAMRQAVSATPIEGERITVSCGVAAAGSPFDFAAVFTRADRGLYEAKRLGRDRVCAPGPTSDAAAAASEPPAATGEAIALRAARRRRAADRVPERPAPADSWSVRIDSERAASGSWLLTDALEREHMIEVVERIGKVRRASWAVIAAAIVAAGFWYGWLALVPPVTAALVLAVVERQMKRFRRPEYVVGVTCLLTFAGNGMGLIVAHGRPLCALPMLILTVAAWSPAFPARGVVVGVGVQALVLTGVAFGVDPNQILAAPGVLALPLALLGTAGMIGAAVGQSAVDHRGAAIVDELTGMLNRAALESRVAELAHQAAATGDRIALIIGDLDNFKAANDRFGHATGDVVLRDVAYRIRSTLRAFEPAYRLGGEEFCVLLPGVGVEEAAAVADRMRDAVRSAPIERVTATMSFGVSASAAGGGFDYPAVFAEADAALYAAKRGGRDRVCVHEARSLAAA